MPQQKGAHRPHVTENPVALGGGAQAVNLGRSAGARAAPELTLDHARVALAEDHERLLEAAEQQVERFVRASSPSALPRLGGFLSDSASETA